jgi:hypothetical protein
MMEYWNGGMMGLKEEKQSNMMSSASVTHYSIIPTFHYSVSATKTPLTSMNCRTPEMSWLQN